MVSRSNFRDNTNLAFFSYLPLGWAPNCRGNDFLRSLQGSLSQKLMPLCSDSVKMQLVVSLWETRLVQVCCLSCRTIIWTSESKQ